MGFKSSEVHLIAEEIEHINSPIFFRKVKNMLNEKNVDPHGSSIPDIDF
jgi:DtxR family Mn-dependent transcriptional regulator